MRISDWSSDVCSSDLMGRLLLRRSYGSDRSRSFSISSSRLAARLLSVAMRSSTWIRSLSARISAFNALVSASSCGTNSGPSWPRRPRKPECTPYFARMMLPIVTIRTMPMTISKGFMGRFLSRMSVERRVAQLFDFVGDIDALVGHDAFEDADAFLQSFGLGRILRSEEHTSELQSLMRITYAVF